MAWICLETGLPSATVQDRVSNCSTKVPRKNNYKNLRVPTSENLSNTRALTSYGWPWTKALPKHSIDFETFVREGLNLVHGKGMSQSQTHTDIPVQAGIDFFLFLFFSFFLSFFFLSFLLTYLLTFLLSPVRVRGYSPVKEAGWHNFTNQSGFGRIVRKIFERWTRTKLPLQHATIHHCGNILNKNLPKCHPSGLMDGHVSCEACNKYSTPNSSMDSRKRI